LKLINPTYYFSLEEVESLSIILSAFYILSLIGALSVVTFYSLGLLENEIKT